MTENSPTVIDSIQDDENIILSKSGACKDQEVKKVVRKRKPRTGIAKGMRVRVYPTSEQESKLIAWMGACRWTWNWALNQQNDHYTKTKKTLSLNTLSKDLTLALKAGVDPVSGNNIEWLKEVPRTSLTCTFNSLKGSWQAFFDGCSGKRSDCPEKPKFKAYSDTKKSISFQVDPRHGNKLTLPKGFDRQSRFQEKFQEESQENVDFSSTNTCARSNSTKSNPIKLPATIPGQSRLKEKRSPNGAISIPLLGDIPALFTEAVPGELTQITVSFEAGKWFAALGLVNVPEKAALRLQDWTVLTQSEAFEQDPRIRQFENPLDLNGFSAMDASITNGMVVTNNGKTTHVLMSKVDQEKDDKKREGRKRCQRAFSRKQKLALQKYNQAHGNPVNTPLPKGVKLEKSKRQQKLLDRASKIDRSIRNTKHDRIHKFTTNQVRENHTIIIESLNLAGMAKSLNRGFRRRMLEASIGEVFRQLEYKSSWYDRNLIVVDKWFPSSKRCSNTKCHQKNQDLKLSDRVWVCPHCLTKWVRDNNACFNLFQEGIRIVYENHKVPLPSIFAPSESTGYTAGSAVNRRAIEGDLMVGESTSSSVEAPSTGKAEHRLRRKVSLNRELSLSPSFDFASGENQR